VKRLFSPLLFLLFLLALTSGCTAAPGNVAEPPAAPGNVAGPPASPENERAASGYEPVTLTNCGREVTFSRPPERAVTMNQAAAEILLALGLEESMVGTAYLDDSILPELRAAYETVPVLADQYPTQEVLLAAEPDFVYGSYASAFGDEAAGSREQLASLGIGSYLSPVACEDRALRPEIVTMQTVFDEIRDLGRIFGVGARAEELIASMEAELAEIRPTEDTTTRPTIFWYDSEDPPYAGACCGAPNAIIELAGGTNIFADAPGSWSTVTWEEVVARDPEVIVLIEAEWSPAEEKRRELMENPAYASIRAVREQHFVVIDFSYTTAGIRNVRAATMLAHALDLEFSGE
jgi:iron complex transport system substrate-binding protein